MANWDFFAWLPPRKIILCKSVLQTLKQNQKNFIVKLLTVIKNHQDNKTYSGNYGKPYHEFKHLQPINKTGCKKLKQERKKFSLHNPLEPIK